MPNIRKTRVKNRLIGGVFPLAKTPNTANGETILQHLSDTAEAIYYFHNARSALHYVFLGLSPTRIWLPAFLCPDILQAMIGVHATYHYFPLTNDLQPDVDFLENKLKPDDVVLTINYFGRGPCKKWTQFIARHPNVSWIEDCAQAIDCVSDTKSDFRTHSPRKILGVPDGGILIDRLSQLSVPELTQVTDFEFMVPYQLRAKDNVDNNNAVWFEAYRNAELAQVVSTTAISNLSHDLLATTLLNPIIQARRENYKYLYAHLKDLALFPDCQDIWTPLCFPILSTEADELANHLAKNGVFPPRYWRNLPSEPHEFPFEHNLSEKLLGLPCDQRYSVQDMMKIVQLIRGLQP